MSRFYIINRQLVTTEQGQSSIKSIVVDKDEGIRPGTTFEGVSQIKPALEGGVIAAGNASQFSDGASAQVIMSEKLASSKNIAEISRLLPLLGFITLSLES